MEPIKMFKQTMHRAIQLTMVSVLLTACTAESESGAAGTTGPAGNLTGVWVRETADGTGDETDIVFGLVEGEPPNRVWACEVRPNVPAVIVQRGFLTGNRIRWDAVHGGVPDYEVGRTGNRMWVDVQYPGTARTYYNTGTWHRLCPSLEDTRIFVLFTMTGGPGARLTSVSSTLGCAPSPVPGQRYNRCAPGSFTYSITASNGLTATNVPARLEKPADGMRRIYSVGFHYNEILNRYLVGAHFEDVSNVSGRIVIHAGDGQTAERGKSVPVPPAARVITSDGKPVVGATVVFRLVEGGGSIEVMGMPATGVSIKTDSNGVAALEKWTLGNDLGLNRITASALDMDGSPISFRATSTEDQLISVHGGAFYSCALSQSSRLYCWGGGATHGNSNPSALPSEAGPNVRLASMDAGDSHACGLDSTGRAMCWGANNFGQLANPAASGLPEVLPTALRFTSIAAGANHTCALTAAGVAYCWGDNRGGQLGDNTIQQRSAPTVVSGGLTFSSLSAGSNHTCGITTAGDAYCWGLNAVNGTLTFKSSGGALGDGTQTNRRVPTLVSGSHKYTAIAAGDGTTCGVRTDGLVFCWGDNAGGVLGTPSTAAALVVPTQVRGSTVFARVAAGSNHNCGITATGAVLCWGLSSQGALGHEGSTTTPTQVSGNYSQLSAGTQHTCAVSTTDLKVYCWGKNDWRQLGTGTNEANLRAPTRITDFRQPWI